MANDTFNGSTPQEAADEIFRAINVGSGVAYNSDAKTLSGVVDDMADDKYLKVGWRGFYTEGIKCDIDSAETRAIASANQYTDTAIANITGLSIEGLSGASGVSYNSANKVISGRVDNVAQQGEGGYLKVGGGGFYVSGINSAIEAAKQEAILSAVSASTGAIGAKNGVKVTVQDGVKTVEGVVDGNQSEDFLKVGGNGFYTTGITGAIDTAKQQAISESTAYTNQEITNVQENVNSAITLINQKIDTISGETSGMEDTAVTYSMLDANEPRPVLVKNETGAGSGTGNVQFTTGLTVNNTGDLSGHNISAQTVVVTSGITANNLTTSSITYNGTALTEYIENTVTSITEDHDEKVKQQPYTGTAAKPIIVNTNGAENTSGVGFVTAVTVDGNGGLSAASASIDSIASTSITATNLSVNNLSATAITYSGQSLNEYISQTADDKNVSQTPFTGTGSAYMLLHTGASSSTTSVSYVTGVSSDNAGNLKSASVSAGTIEGLTVTGTTVLGNTIKSGATDLSDLFVGTARTISGTGYLEGGGDLSGNRTITHKELHNATGQTTPNTAQTPRFGDTFNIPVVAYDKAGHISSVSTTTVALPTPGASSDSAVTQTSFTGTGSAYMVLHTGTSSSTTGVSYVTGVSSDNAGNLKSASVSAGTISAATSMVTSAMTANTISAGTNSADTAVTVTGVVEATKFVGIIDCGTYSGDTSN